MQLESAQSWSIHGLSTDRPQKSSPEPGIYDPTLMKYSRAINTSPTLLCDAAPGSYNPSNLSYEYSPGFKIGKSARSFFATASTPGLAHINQQVF
jgi:hypothetical protein